MRHAIPRWCGLVVVVLLAACGGGDAVDRDGDGVTDDTDCDDFDPLVHPGATEVCDGVDTDCDGALGPSEDDDDHDGAARCQGDCDDADPAVRPGATEVCNGRDDDCDSATDEDAVDAATWYADGDGDGWGAGTRQRGCSPPTTGVAAQAGDCDDGERTVHPGAAEICDAVDRDCDGSATDGAIDALTWYGDGDGDGWGTGAAVMGCARPATGTALLPGDCDDAAVTTFPGAPELCDAIDRNCDGDPTAGAVDTLTWYADGDADGWGAGAAVRGCVRPATGTSLVHGDCNDAAATTYPGAPELCDAADRNCDGNPTAGAVDTLTWFADGDGDGWGTGAAITGCVRPATGTSLVHGDCNDGAATTYPGATEWCDAADRDCDGSPTAGAVDTLTWFVDGDADGWGTGNPITGCSRPANGTSLIVGDCDDAAAATHPGATEYCDAVDRDCNGDTTAGAVDASRYYPDADHDGHGDPAAPLWACAPPAGALATADDCDDSIATAFPGSTAIETPGDGVDTDCDGIDACTDLNCDGLPDVVVPSHHDGDYNVTQAARLLSGPTGLALEPTPLSMVGVLGSAVADLDHDGYQDIVHASHYNSSSYSLDSYIYWGSASGHGVFDRQGLPTVGAYWPVIADLDGDGWEDLVFADYYDGDYVTDSYIYWNRQGVFSPFDRTSLPSVGTTWISVGHLNQDAFPELVFSNYYNNGYNINSYVYWGSANGYGVGNRTDLPTSGTYSNTIADVDGDGDHDIVYWSHYNGSSHVNSSTYIYWNDGAGFSPFNRTALDGMGGHRGLVADLNADGNNDVVVPGYYNNSWGNMAYTYVYWGNANDVYGNSNRTTLSLRGALVALADDINRDGRKDLLLSSHHDGDSYAPSAVFWGRAGGGGFADGERTEMYGYQPEFGAAIRDFDHDGYKDVFLPGYHNNGWQNQAYSRLYRGGPSGINPGMYQEWPTRGAWSAVVVGN
jgi:hypothetical protein